MLSKPKLIKETERNKHSQMHGLFKCNCGNEFEASLYHVKCGHTKSCGCLVASRKGKPIEWTTTHGMTETPEYNTWQLIKGRCYNKNIRNYSSYGGRGILMSDDWLNSFENFYRDMGARPSGHSIDRIDNNKGYSKDNCRWATRIEQGSNKRNNVMVKLDGKMLTVAAACHITGLNATMVYDRIKRGWSNPLLVK